MQISSHSRGSRKLKAAFIAGAGLTEPEYKFKETVRRKADREALQGFDCPDCRGFYEAMASWGHLKVSQLPSCGHAPPGMLFHLDCKSQAALL